MFRKTVVHEALVAFGLLAGAIAGLGTAYQFLENPFLRWMVFLVAAILFYLASLSEPDRKRRIIDGAVWSDRWRRVSIAFFMIVVADIGFSWIRYPVKVNSIIKQPGGVSGYLRTPPPDHPIMTEDISSVAAASDEALILAENNFPFVLDTKLRRCLGMDEIILTGMRVEVVKFADIPEFRIAASPGGVFEAIDAYFILKKGNASPTPTTPWTPKLVDVTVDGTSIVIIDSKTGRFQQSIADFGIKMMRYHFAAADPGIYWVKLFVSAENGMGKSREKLLTPNPIPLAFYAATEEEFNFGPIPIDKQQDAFKQELAETIELIGGLRSQQWMLFPRRSRAAHVQAIEYLKSRRLEIENELKVLTAPVAPAPAP